MIALELTDVKDFMNKLLRSDTFDHFLLQEAAIINGASFVIDGHVNQSFYTESEIEELGITGYRIMPFSMLRQQCFDLIKGKKTPTSLFLNLKFQNQLLTLTTGISYNIFSPDKSLENEWDQLVRRFLAQHEIDFEEL